MAERIGELQSKRDLYSKHYLNSDGSITAEISGVPVHYKDGEQYKDCELNLIEERNWEFEYAVKKNNFRAYFNDVTDLENYTLASFEIVNSQGVSRWINYKLFGATPTEDIIQDNTILYKNCFPNVDLKYYVDTWRLKEDIIINAPVENFEYEFSLKLDGARLEQQEDGSILFVDIDTEEVLWRIEKPYAKDAEDKLTYGVQYTLGKVAYNGIEYDSIKVKITDNEFLQNAVYPITIDPTTTYDTASTENDCFIGYYREAGLPTSSLFDSRAIQKTINIVAARSKSSKYTLQVGLMRFNTASIPDDSLVISAQIEGLCSNKNNTDSYNFAIEYCNWTPGTDEHMFSYFTTAYKDDAFSLTSISNLAENGSKQIFNLANLQNIIKNGYTGFRMHVHGGTPTYYNAYGIKAIDDYANRPILKITYNTPPTTPTLLTPNGGENIDANCTITWEAASDPDGDSLTYELQYSLNNGGSWANIVTGRTGTSYDWNTSTLPDGNQCLVRIRAKDSTGLYSDYDQSDAVFTISHGKVFLKQNGAYKKVKVFEKIGGVYTEIKAYRKDGGTYIKS